MSSATTDPTQARLQEIVHRGPASSVISRARPRRRRGWILSAPIPLSPAPSPRSMNGTSCRSSSSPTRLISPCRTVGRHPSRVLEIAAGTGVVTRQLATTLPPGVSIVATDLNQTMLDQAAAEGTARPVEWRQADALQLPFPDEFFDVVVCQFGVMFFPDKARAFAEARRVLRSGGQFIFNVWDRIDHNDFADTVTRALGTLFPDDPPRFLARVPHGYHDPSVIARICAGRIHAVTPDDHAARAQPGCLAAHSRRCVLPGRTASRRDRGRDPSRLIEATDIATAAIAHRSARKPWTGRSGAHRGY